ncbi:MAG: DUF748 domain-containing protein [Candidatus Omnitrophica bacterium]|nr:DUF748 domain-containing protein [Candidatus Omnitrophota bacterium]MDE2009212.1 DUF748 domain-containing protein [Candidatus Omnitrophota bacterium]MDE2230692.1 DUF748 domain-containing protein [Candidatus Omnitrophota bacterium]
MFKPTASKILRAFTKIITGLFLFYLVAGFIIIPFVLWWVIPDQGTKILKEPVRLRSVGFNPLLWKLTMNGFEILDHHHHQVIGFDKLSVNLSLAGLFKKIYHVPAFELDGLKVNAVLLPGNKINLLDLVPPQLMPPPQPRRPTGESKQPSASGLPRPSGLPKIIIDTIALHQGEVHFTDTTIKPHFSVTLRSMEMLVTHVTTDPHRQARVKFHCDLGNKGRISMEAAVIPLAQPLDLEAAFSLNDYALKVLTPYTGKYTGRALKSGQMDFSMDYRISGNKLVADHRLLIQQFAFGRRVESKGALHLPFGLAVALLEDPDGRMRISLPVSGDMSDPKFKYSHLVFQAARNFFFNLVTKPFSFLASSLGAGETGVDELGYVRFTPGEAKLLPSQRQKLIALIKGLKAHPKLELKIDGSYDPRADWKAIQAQVFARDYEQLRKISSRPDAAVYQLLYQRRFGIRALWALAKKYKKGIGRYDDAKLDLEIKRRLVENAPPDTGALNTLAQARARLVHQFLLVHGFDAGHMVLGAPQTTQSRMGYVPLPFTLTVYNRN